MATLNNCFQIKTPQGETTVALTIKNNSLYAQVSLSQRTIEIPPEQIKCGISGRVSHLDFIRRVDQIARDKLVAFIYPSVEQPTEVWIFEATPLTAPVIKKARDHLKQEDLEQGIKQLETAIKLQQQQKGDVQELESTIFQLKKELFVRQIKKDAHLFLSPEEVKKLNNIIEDYQHYEDPFFLWSQYLETFGLTQPHLFYLSALLNEHEGKIVEAAPKYLYLALKHPHPIHCLKRAAEIVKGASDPLAFPHFLERLDREWLFKLSEESQDPELKRWVLLKDALRMTFESCLAELCRSFPHPQAPTCFICFNVEEADVGKWLEQTLVPDLDRMGVRSLFCFRDLGPGKELNNFQALIRHADRVIIVCTPDLKRKCDERKKAPTGVAQEIRIARERYNDPDKYETIFPLYVKGDRKDACPDEFFEPILGTNFTFLNKSTEVSVFSYYAQAFELLGGMRRIPRERSREMKEAFLVKASRVLRGEIDHENLGQWRMSRVAKVEAILKSAEQLVSQKTQMVNLPEAPKDFTGRTQDLKKLLEACQNKRCVAVTGLGGIGKTALALKYANDNQLRYQFIHFMPAGTPQLIIDGLLKLADDLHIPPIDKVNDRLLLLKTTLDRFEQDFLLILDGIDQIEAFDEASQYLPQRGRCLLLTTRMPQQSAIRGFELIELNPFVLEEAVRYLLQTTGSREETAAKELAEKLGRLPLALTHAARYIQSQKISVQKYIELLNRHELELFRDRYLTLTREEKTILTTWALSIQVIEKTHQCLIARELLTSLAYLGQAPIPRELIENWFKQAYSGKSELEVGNALKYLCDYSLIDSPLPNTYTLHPLVQSVTRLQLTPANQRMAVSNALNSLTSLLEQSDQGSGTVQNARNLALGKLCIPHAMEIVNRLDLTTDMPLEARFKFLSILIKICLKIENPSRKLEEISRMCLQLAEARHQTSSSLQTCEALASSLNNLGLILKLLGRAHESVNYHQRAMEVLRSFSGANPVDIAASYNNRGLALQASGAAEASLEAHKKALEIWRPIFGEKHLHIATCYNNIGIALKDLGRFRESFDYHKRAYQMRLDLFGENSQHPDLAQSANNLGLVLLDLDDSDQALIYLQKAFNIWNSLYGEKNALVALCTFNLGNVLKAIGKKSGNSQKIEEGLRLYQKALETLLTIFGENHPHVAAAYNGIGSAQQAIGQIEKNEEKIRQSLDFYQIGLNILHSLHRENPNHPAFAEVYNNIGSVHVALGQRQEAIEFFKKAIRIWESFPSPNYSSIGVGYNNIGWAYEQSGDRAKALENYLKAWSNLTKVYDKSHYIMRIVQSGIERVQPK